MRNEIQWLTEDIAMPEIDTARLSRWIEVVAAEHGRSLGPLTYVFCSDPVILRVNRQFLNHDYFTDIITFDYSRNTRISGDMYISLDTVETNAITVNAPYSTELLRVIIHGVLHLCGINDKGPGEREIMEGHENRALELLPSIV